MSDFPRVPRGFGKLAVFAVLTNIAFIAVIIAMIAVAVKWIIG